MEDYAETNMSQMSTTNVVDDEDIEERARNVELSPESGLHNREQIDQNDHLSDSELNDSENDILRIFNRFDKNKDGFIDEDELREVMMYMFQDEKLSDAALEDLIQKVDKNSDGRIDYHEFTKMTMEMFENNESIESLDYSREDILRAKFQELDINGDGFIDFDELRRDIEQDDLLETRIKLMMSYCDLDGNGKLDFEEFVKMHNGPRKNLTVDGIFRAFDLNNDGFIDREEYRNITRVLDPHFSEEKFEMMMEQMDADGDGRISYAEFQNAYNQ